MFVLAHEPAPMDRRPLAESLRQAARAARESDLPVVRLPFPFPDPDKVLPDELPGTLAIYSGPIPQRFGDYENLEAAVRQRGAELANSAAASAQASHIDQWADKLAGLTAATVILRGPGDLNRAAALGFPVFVKGLVKSLKESGPEAVFAADPETLRSWAQATWSRGTELVARERLPLRLTGESTMRFPHGREYRCLTLDGELLCPPRFYWQAADPFGEPDVEVSVLVAETAARLEARLLAVDVGQLEDNTWRVIEVGDAQHTGLNHIAPHRYWSVLRDRLTEES